MGTSIFQETVMTIIMISVIMILVFFWEDNPYIIHDGVWWWYLVMGISIFQETDVICDYDISSFSSHDNPWSVWIYKERLKILSDLFTFLLISGGIHWFHERYLFCALYVYRESNWAVPSKGC